jgi:hypothetical protein
MRPAPPGVKAIYDALLINVYLSSRRRSARLRRSKLAPSDAGGLVSGLILKSDFKDLAAEYPVLKEQA